MEWLVNHLDKAEQRGSGSFHAGMEEECRKFRILFPALAIAIAES